MSWLWFILTAIIFARSFADEIDTPVEVEVTASGDIASHNGGFSETGPPVDPPLVFRTVEKPPSTQFWVTFINKSPKTVELVWDDGGRKGRLQSTLEPEQSTRIGTFEGHIFFYRYPGEYRKEYVCYMKNGETLFEFKDEETRQREKQQFEEDKRVFKQEYLDRTGRKWEAHFPRNPPIHHMYPAEYVGQKHKITSNHSFYTCYPVTDSAEDVAKCRDDSNVLAFEWEVMSLSPRVIYLAQPFLSDWEIEHIQMVATPKLTDSTVGHGEGAYASRTRTSKGCFIDRCETDVIDWIFRRIADVTQIPEDFLWHMIGSENLQVLRYDKEQQFKPHNDYNNEREQMRYITFLMYLNTLEEDQGGATTFPLANLSVTPVKGHVVAFYSILEDGNSDYMSMHASTPIKYGTKWSCPVWIWDPAQS
eukprot:489246_1